MTTYTVCSTCGTPHLFDPSWDVEQCPDCYYADNHEPLDDTSENDWLDFLEDSYLDDSPWDLDEHDED